jgi:uncharacterized protein (DUF924 family)
MRIPPLVPKLIDAFRMDVLIDIQWRRDGHSAWKGRTQCSDQDLVAKYMETMSEIANATKKSLVAFVSIHLAVDLFSVFSRLFIRPVIMICYRPRVAQ